MEVSDRSESFLSTLSLTIFCESLTRISARLSSFACEKIASSKSDFEIFPAISVIECVSSSLSGLFSRSVHFLYSSALTVLWITSEATTTSSGSAEAPMIGAPIPLASIPVRIFRAIFVTIGIVSLSKIASLSSTEPFLNSS